MNNQNKTLLLFRETTSTHGTFGTLVIPGFKNYHSIELQWRQNQSNISCIPVGNYRCTFNYSPAFKRKMYLVQNVKGRSGIRIHAGNLAGNKDKGMKADFAGCIAFGTSKGILHGQQAVFNTAYAIREIEKYLNHEDFNLIILGEFYE